MCWINFHNAILCCGFLYDRLMSLLFCLYFVFLFCVYLLSFPATTPRATTPHPYHHGLSRLCMHPGYHAIVYFYSLVITPELSRSTTHVHRVITPAISNSHFVVYLSPAFTLPVLLHLHHHRGATRTNLLHSRLKVSQQTALHTPCNTAVVYLSLIHISESRRTRCTRSVVVREP